MPHLMQADVDLTEISLQTEATEPMWVELYAEKQGQRVDGLGELQITVWLAPAGHLGRLDDGMSLLCCSDSNGLLHNRDCTWPRSIHSNQIQIHIHWK